MQSLPRMRSVGLIGAGKMAKAIANGILSTNRAAELSRDKSIKVMASCPREELLRALPDDCRSTTNNLETVENSDLIIIAVKPDVVRSVLDEICPKIDPKKHVVMSIAAGVTVSTFEEALPAGTNIVRVMPNIACEVREGATVYYTRGESNELGQITQAVFAPISPICQRILDEKLMDAATALSGSGTAYVLYIIEALVDAGVRQGFSREVALRLATQTVQGAARLIHDSGRSPTELKDYVTSPGGTTSEGLFVLEKYAVKSAIHDAVHSARKKSDVLR
ncbi:pyrroline-5-carboxylate reductase 3 [Galendromus occidentalis]|uniref:Pyrroline-5-carboxylate reductase n=1 Tax=Galendromus occidentalis TaxID=34638 RepID=A0AAJ6VV59_9ACAR|nr:pyrroline-5-carboxylate reductase 3 [Galendromus occidentalis]